MNSKCFACFWTVAIASLLAAGAAFGQPGTTERVSLPTGPGEGNGPSYSASISSDGRFVAFVSVATDLATGAPLGYSGVYIRDRLLSNTEPVSVSSVEIPANDWSDRCCVSANGRYVVFESLASNLVSNEVNGDWDVFVRDRLLGITGIVSVSSSGLRGNGPSGFQSLAISADGRFVAFGSAASNLVANDTNGCVDVYVRDRLLGTTELASVASDGTQGDDDSGSFDAGPSLSADGRFVVFGSIASNLVADDTNDSPDIFIRDRQLGTTKRVSVSTAGQQASGGSWRPSISADGRTVTLFSLAPDLVPGDTNGKWDVFAHDMLTGVTECESVSSAGVEGNSDSDAPGTSANGRFVSFQSYATNLVSGDTNQCRDVFVRDRFLGTTTRVSVSSAGQQGNSDSEQPCISADGRFVAFDSWADDLVSDDANVFGDVFIHQLGPDGGWPATRGQLALNTGVLPPVAMFEFRVPGQTGTAASWAGGIALDGSFVLPSPIAVFDLSVKVTHWLRRTVHGLDATKGSVSAGSMMLINGDANGDNQVGLQDLSNILRLMTRTDPMSDLDGNGAVGLGDLSIVLANFSAAGDP